MKTRYEILSLAALALACQNGRPSPYDKASAEPDLVKRGERLVQLGGCSDCHTPVAFDPKLKMPVPQRELFLSGHPASAPGPSARPGPTDTAVIGPTFTSFAAPFGVVYARNLTPDPETGLGSWSEAEFIQTARTGHRRGTGRPILPPMPWQNLSTLPVEELQAIYAYLRTIKPVKNSVPEPEVPAPVIAAIGESFPKHEKGIN